MMRKLHKKIYINDLTQCKCETRMIGILQHKRLQENAGWREK